MSLYFTILAPFSQLASKTSLALRPIKLGIQMAEKLCATAKEIKAQL
jgi:hypothetical protein